MGRKPTPVTALDSQGRLHHFDSQIECAKELGINTTHLNEMVKGKRLCAQGYIILPYSISELEWSLLSKYMTERFTWNTKNSTNFLAYRRGFLEAMSFISKNLGDDTHDELIKQYIIEHPKESMSNESKD